MLRLARRLATVNTAARSQLAHGRISGARPAGCSGPIRVPTRAFSSTSASSPPPPPPSPPSSSKYQLLLAAVARRSAALIASGARASYRATYKYARRKPGHFLLLLTACGLGFLWGRHRRSGLTGGDDASRQPDDGGQLPTFRSPAWANTPATKELAQLLHILPRVVYLMRIGEEHSAIGQQASSSISASPSLTPAQTMERIRVLLDDSTILTVVAAHVPPSALIEPLVALVCNPLVHPHMAKYAAVCLNRMCNEGDGRLCKQVATHSSYDLLISLSQYTDFLSWNYLYLLQQQPQLVAVAERWLQGRTSPSTSADIPLFLRPFHFSSSAPSPSSTSTPTTPDDTLSMNHNTSPVTNFLSHFLAPQSTNRSQSQAHISTEARDLISLLLALPPVQTAAGKSPVGILHHAMKAGAAQRESGSGIVETARRMGADVVQQGAALAAAYRSALAGDDLAVLTAASLRWNPDRAAEPNGLLERVADGAQAVGTQAYDALHSFLARRPGYKLGQQQQYERRTAQKQEVAYHAFRALATLSQDADTAGLIIEHGGIDKLYAVYQQYPHEVRVQIQVARALANLLEHAHARLNGVDHAADANETDARYATYHAVARSGFLPMLAHWNQHALNYTDAAAAKPKKTRSTVKKVKPATDSALVLTSAETSPTEVPIPAATTAPTTPAVAVAPVTVVEEEPHPLRQPHHPESSASLRNKLQLQAARALVNLRSIQGYKYLSEHDADKQRWLRTHDGIVNFPMLGDEVYQFYPLVDSLQSPVTGAQLSNAQKHSTSAKDHLNGTKSRTSPTASTAPVAPPQIEYDIVFLHGLMGNPLRTWRLHSMHDRTIGWIPSTPEEKRRAGLLLASGSTTPVTADSKTAASKSQASVSKQSSLDAHLSNVVISAPLPVVDASAPAATKSIGDADDPTAMADRTNVFGDLSLPLSTRASEAAAITPIDGTSSPVAVPSTGDPSALIHSSQHSLDFETLWPRDWLPSAFPNARILSLGYTTPLSMQNAGELHSRSLEDRAADMAERMELAGIGKDGRKVIWVVHSMGGLVVKQVLLNAAHAQKAALARGYDPSTAAHAHLLDSTIATVFYSTPHAGTWLPLSQDSLLSYVYLPSHELLDLQNQPKLRSMNAEFKREVIDEHGIRALSMGEGIGTPIIHLNRTAQKIINWKFVPIESSQPGFGEYLYFPTQNHLTICKPKTELDENYSALRTFIQETMQAQASSQHEDRHD